MTDAERQELINLRAEVEALWRANRSLERQIHHHGEWLDTVNSPLWKRVWWFLQGWRFYTLGRWYGKE